MPEVFNILESLKSSPWILQTPKPFQTECDHFQHPEQVSKPEMAPTNGSYSAQNFSKCSQVRRVEETCPAQNHHQKFEVFKL
jgi:hypothetical protein